MLDARCRILWLRVQCVGDEAATAAACWLVYFVGIRDSLSKADDRLDHRKRNQKRARWFAMRCDEVMVQRQRDRLHWRVVMAWSKSSKVIALQQEGQAAGC